MLIAAEYRILGTPTIPILNLFSASNRKKFIKVDPARGSNDTSMGLILKCVIGVHRNHMNYNYFLYYLKLDRLL
jgi:hypothetical protein